MSYEIDSARSYSRLKHSYTNNPHISCREYSHYLANKTKIKKITFRGNELLNRLYDTSLNKYKDERRKELQKKYTINSTKKKK